MSWPTPAEINEAMQSPEVSFHDPDLAAGRAEADPHGIPLARSGSNADVYCVACGPDRVAVKCFTRPVAPHLGRRYEAIHNVLKTLRLPFTVDFGYQAKGVWLREEWYPLVRMQWVDGIRLNEFVRAAAGRKSMLGALVKILATMGNWLEVNRLGHCDLQHGNVLLIPSHGGRKLALRLVDYDGMWVPALDRDPPQEFGHPDYQHPARLAGGYYGPAADRFSLLAIATGLHAVTAHGAELWKRYDNEVNILFTQQDYADPHRSPLMAELSRSPDDLVRRLCGSLAEACTGPLDRVRPLSEVLAGTAAVSAGGGVPTARTVEVMPLPDEDEHFDFQFGPPAAGAVSGYAPAGRPRPGQRPGARAGWLWGGVAAATLLLAGLLVWGVGAARDKSPAGAVAKEKDRQPKTGDKTARKKGTAEDKGRKAVDAFYRDTRRFVVEKPWQFNRNVNGQQTPLARLTLAEDGRILGSGHANETTWSVEGPALLFRNRRGQTTTRFVRAELRGNQVVLVGTFLQNGQEIHELVRDVE